MLSRRTFVTAGLASAVAGTALWSTPRALAAAALPLNLRNNSGSGTVFAYISGSDSSGWPGFVTADGRFQRLANPSARRYRPARVGRLTIR